MKTTKILYWVGTVLLTLVMFMSIGMYLFNYEVPRQAFGNLGFPTFLIYPLALAKALGLVAIWMKKSRSLTEWAYAGFFFNTLIAASGHIMAGDGEFFGALIAMIGTLLSYYGYRKLFV